MFEAYFEVVFVDHFVFIGVKEVKELEDLFVHVLVLDYAALAGTYIEMMARNYERTTWSYPSL
jgi:hypothetical protein